MLWEEKRTRKDIRCGQCREKWLLNKRGVMNSNSFAMLMSQIINKRLLFNRRTACLLHFWQEFLTKNNLTKFSSDCMTAINFGRNIRSLQWLSTARFLTGASTGEVLLGLSLISLSSTA